MTNRQSADDRWAQNKMERLKGDKRDRLTCCECNNQTFLLDFGCIDFPFFDCICSKCGSVSVRVGK